MTLLGVPSRLIRSPAVLDTGQRQCSQLVRPDFTCRSVVSRIYRRRYLEPCIELNGSVSRETVVTARKRIQRMMSVVPLQRDAAHETGDSIASRFSCPG